MQFPLLLSGSPQTASPAILARVRGGGQNLQEIRRQIVQRIISQKGLQTSN
ncbi:MAG: hypothetical protein KME21_00095 [Desmonostoc vinosum HA7617-LM4]|jgi:hypothetical protein|nr:hypothetical protein [Desmonostoc vinosum HA7617-LM4]